MASLCSELGRTRHEALTMLSTVCTRIPLILHVVWPSPSICGECVLSKGTCINLCQGFALHSIPLGVHAQVFVCLCVFVSTAILAL